MIEEGGKDSELRFHTQPQGALYSLAKVPLHHTTSVRYETPIGNKQVLICGSSHCTSRNDVV